MRRGVGSVIAGVVVLATVGLLVFRSPASRATDTGPATQGSRAKKVGREMPAPPRRATRPSGSSLAELPPAAQPPQPVGSPGNRKWADERVEELEKLAWFDDAASLHNILAELYSPLPEVRAAALAATRAFGSKDAVPYLEQAENGTSDPLERKALTDAIEYLKLPTLLEEQTGEVQPEN